MNVASRAIVCGLVLLVGCAAQGSDWPQFRGPGGSSVSMDTGLPTTGELGSQVAWKQEVPGRAVSGPIVVQGRVICTGSGGANDDRLFVTCHDAKTGELVWQREFWATGRTQRHPTSAVAAPTAASDGESIYAFFSSNDLVCLSLDGDLRWLRGLTADHPASYNDTGMASSPLVMGDTVVVQMECQGDSFAAGIDKHTGETRWRRDRLKSANWVSPAGYSRAGRNVALLQSSDQLTAHDALTGEELWRFGKSCSTIPSVCVGSDTLYVPSDGITALALGQGNEQPNERWQVSRLAPDNASPVVAGDRVYVINGAGVLVVASADDGKIVWQLRLTGSFWATPVVADGHLFAVNQDGMLQVIRLDDAGGKGEVVAKHELGEAVLGSPAVADGALFIRGDGHLWKFGK
ncbi:MAG: PQQ-binding-like beta-propeller repeat protein [Pirellulales bacterium]|nr:PQQ-binding-like beta-propeller repeat protein [Pirellulales bacterium]